MTKIRLPPIVLGLCALMACACGGSGSSGSGPRSITTLAAGNQHLAQALSLIPRNAGPDYSFEFADWDAIARALGFRSIATVSSLTAFTRELAKLGFPPSGNNAEFDLQPPRPGIGWSAGQVSWDGSVAAFNRSWHVDATKLHPHVSLTTAEHGVSRCARIHKTLSGWTVYFFSAGAFLTRCTDSFGNSTIPFSSATSAAFDPRGPLVLESNRPPFVLQEIRGSSSSIGSPAAATLIRALQGSDAVSINLGPAFCSLLANPVTLAGRSASPATVGSAGRRYPADHPYLGFGFGYSFGRSTATATLAFAYASHNAAVADLPRRESTVRHGVSLQTHIPYSQGLRLTSGTVSGNTLILRSAQPPGRPLALSNLFNQLDLGFARCG